MEFYYWMNHTNWNRNEPVIAGNRTNSNRTGGFMEDLLLLLLLEVFDTSSLGSNSQPGGTVTPRGQALPPPRVLCQIA